MAELKIIRMSDIQSEPVEWLWEPYLPSGAISLIQGDGGQGKTTLSLVIAAAITKGEPLPGKYGGGYAAPANVIIQNAEDSYAMTIKPRLEKLGADCDRVYTIDEDEQSLSYADERIEQTIIQTNAKLLIIDPLQAFWGGANMNAANSVRPLLKHLGAVAAQHGCCVLLVGHLHKKGGKAQYRGLGSIDIFAAARSVLTVGNVGSDDNIRAVVHNKSNLAPSGSSLTFELDPVCGFRWTGECDISIDELFNGNLNPKPENQLVKAQKFIEHTLRNGSVAAAEIIKMAEAHGISEKTLQRAKTDMGVFSRKRNNAWYWELPIEAECTVVNEDAQQSQDAHVSTMTALTTLTIFPDQESAAV